MTGVPLPPAGAWQAAAQAVLVGDAEALERLLDDHGSLLRREQPKTSWLGGLAPDYSTGDARSIIARTHCFADWNQFAAYAEALRDAHSPTARFERAVDAVIAGDSRVLGEMVRDDTTLVRARSPRTHGGTLLHYLGANGVEGFRQRTPPNAVAIAAMLIANGADVDATAEIYGGGATTLGLVATSINPQRAGVTRALIDALLAYGARLDRPSAGRGRPLVNSCLANGRLDAATYLARRGAPIDLEAAAGVGRLDLVASYFRTDGSLTDAATPAQMKDGFTWACEYGHTGVVEYLLDRGVDVGELLPRPHGQTGLHWAAQGGHVETVAVLLRRRAPVDVRDRRFDGTPLDWALHGWRDGESDVIATESYLASVVLLVAAGSPVDPRWLGEATVRAHPRMLAALEGAGRHA